MSFKRDLLRINERVLLEEIDQLARTPGPGAERAPVVDLARLTFVDETDDALPQLVIGAAVGLDAARIEIAVAPAERDCRLLPTRGAIRERRVVSGRRCRTAAACAASSGCETCAAKRRGPASARRICRLGGGLAYPAAR